MKQPLKEMLKKIGGGHLLNERVSDNDVLLDKKNKSWSIEQNDIIKALNKDSKIVKHVGKKYLKGSYFDGLDLVADNNDGTTLATLKWTWKLKDLKKAILKSNPARWEEQEITMATRTQILEALRGVRNQFPSNSSYIGVHRSIVSISNGHSIMTNDITEISAVIRDGNGNNK